MRNVFDYWDKLSEEQKEWVRDVERRYGANRWWESEDTVVVIEHQTQERMLMVSFPEYQSALEQFLERPICHLDFGFNNKKLIAEVGLAIKRKKAGIGQSEEQREAARQDYMKRVDYIVNHLLPKGKVMRIEDSSQDPDRNSDGIDTSGYDGWLKP